MKFRTKQGNLLLTSSPEPLEANSSTYLEEDQPIMNHITRSGSTSPEAISNPPPTEAAPTGSFQGIEVTQAPSEGKPISSSHQLAPFSNQPTSSSDQVSFQRSPLYNITQDGLERSKGLDMQKDQGGSITSPQAESIPPQNKPTPAQPVIASGLSHDQRIEVLRSSHGTNAKVQEILKKINSCFDKASKVPSLHIKALLEKAGDYHLQAAEEIVTRGDTQKAENLQNAAQVAIDAARTFEKAGSAATPQGKAAFEQAKNYYLQAAEEIVTRGDTQKAKYLQDAAIAAVMSGTDYEEAGIPATLQGEAAYDKALEYDLQRTEEIAAYGETQKAENLRSAAYRAMDAGEAFKKAEEVTIPQGKEACEIAGRYGLQLVQEKDVHGDSDQAQKLNKIAHPAMEAVEAFEQAEMAKTPQAKEELIRKGKKFLIEAKKWIDVRYYEQHRYPVFVAFILVHLARIWRMLF